MTKLEELINELCPDGVEYKTIGEIATYRRGSFPQPYTNPLFYGGEAAMPFVQVADIENEGFKLKENTKQTISKIAQPKSVFVPAGTVICSIQGTIGRVAITQYDAYIDRTIAIFETFKIEVDKRFFAYCIELKFGIEKLFARGSTLKTITKEEFTRFKIPVPPLEVQNEIGKTLDNFTSLTAELTAELTARQKQYAFYRDYLLDFSNEDVTKKIPDIDCSNVEYKRLGNIAIIERGKRVVRNDLSQEIGYPVYQNALKPLGYYTDKNRNANSVFIVGAGAAGEIGYSYVDYWAADDCFTFVCDDKLNQRYLYFLLMSKQAYLKNNVRKSSIPRLPRIALENMEIPVPPLSVQENIVKILDRFDKLNNDMSDGLPAEIEARKKQYEYYRDTLMSFDDKACSHIVKVERERANTH